MKRPVLAAVPALALVAVLTVEPSVAQLSPDETVPPPATNDYVARTLAGISNQGRNKQQPYVTAGDRTYLIGTQDGNFPDMGQHVLFLNGRPTNPSSSSIQMGGRKNRVVITCTP
jgi:hypothetical protein